MTEKADIVITVERRDNPGKVASRQLRRQGRIPAVVYGGDKEPMSISVDHKSVQELLKQESGGNTIFLLKLKGTKQERRAMIKEIQSDPISHDFTHIDFIRVMKGHKLTVTMPVELTGDCVGLRHGGRLDFVSRELQLEILPREMFDKIEVDVTDLEVGQHVSVADLESQLPESAKFLEDPGRVVVLVEMPRGGVHLGEEGEEEAALVISEQAEPELIRSRSREEDEGGE